MKQTLTFCGRWAYEVDLPESWPEVSLEQTRMIAYGDDTIILAHPEHLPVMYNLETKEYTTMTVGVDGHYYKLRKD